MRQALRDMISAWWKRKAAHPTAKGKQERGKVDVEVIMPNHFRCPITLDLMKDPVTLSTGITYDRHSIEKWIMDGHVTCPLTNQVLNSLEPIPNHSIRRMIQDWCVRNSSHGIERMPTPRVPVSVEDVFRFHSQITRSSRRGDLIGCLNTLVKLKGLLKESERNKKCIVDNGTTSVISCVFQEYSSSRVSRFDENNDHNIRVLEEILSCLTLMFPLEDVEAMTILASPSSLNCIVWFLKSNHGDLSSKRNAILVLKELLFTSSNYSPMDLKNVNIALSEIDGATQALFKLVKEPICSTTKKDSLVIIYHMVTTKQISSPTDSNVTKKTMTEFIDLGMIPLLLEMLIEAERSICEKALRVLDELCEIDFGRYKACSNALTVPVLSKKIHRVSNLASEFSVSILWKLCNKKNTHVIVEALELGAFQKILLLLQVGCGDRTKEKARKLLKLLNLHRGRVNLECIDSMDFKDLKRS